MEDNCESFGAEIENKSGTFGLVNTLSFIILTIFHYRRWSSFNKR